MRLWKSFVGIVLCMFAIFSAHGNSTIASDRILNGAELANWLSRMGTHSYQLGQPKLVLKWAKPIKALFINNDFAEYGPTEEFHATLTELLDASALPYEPVSIGSEKFAFQRNASNGSSGRQHLSNFLFSIIDLRRGSVSSIGIPQRLNVATYGRDITYSAKYGGSLPIVSTGSNIVSTDGQTGMAQISSHEEPLSLSHSCQVNITEQKGEILSAAGYVILEKSGSTIEETKEAVAGCFMAMLGLRTPKGLPRYKNWPSKSKLLNIFYDQKIRAGMVMDKIQVEQLSETVLD